MIIAKEELLPDECATIDAFLDFLLAEYEKPCKMRLKKHQPVVAVTPAHAQDLLVSFSNLTLDARPIDSEKPSNVQNADDGVKSSDVKVRPQSTDDEDGRDRQNNDGEKADAASFDLSRMVPKGPTHPSPINGKVRSNPYPPSQWTRTVIADNRQMNGGGFIETFNSSYVTPPNIAFNINDIPSPVADIESSHNHSNLSQNHNRTTGEDLFDVVSNDDISKLYNILFSAGSSPSLSSPGSSVCTTNITSPSASSVGGSSWVESPESLVGGQQSPCSPDFWDDACNNFYPKGSSAVQAVADPPLLTETEATIDFFELQPKNPSTIMNIPPSQSYHPYVEPIQYHHLHYRNPVHLRNLTCQPNIPPVSPAVHTAPFSNPLSPREASRIPSPSTNQVAGGTSATSPVQTLTATAARPHIYAQTPTSPPIVMNIPSITTSLGDEQTFRLPVTKQSNIPRKTPNASPHSTRKLLPSSDVRAPSASAQAHNLSPQQRIDQMLKPLRKATIWRAVGCLEPWEEFQSKNDSNQTKLMQVLLSEPKPQDLMERIFIIIQRMKHSKAADLLQCRDKYGHSALYQAATLHPDCPVITAFIADSYAFLGCDVNETYENRNTLLHMLAQLGEPYEAVVRELLQLTDNKRNRIVNVNARNADEETPLHLASASHMKKNSTFGIADVLIKRGADVSLVNSKGETPLHIAAKSDACEFNFIKKLLEIPKQAWKAVNTQDENGNTPLHVVAKNVNVNNIRKMQKIMEQLLTSSADVNVRNKAGRLPLSYIHQDCAEEIRSLFQQKRQ